VQKHAVSVLTTTAINNITETTAISGGNITDDGGNTTATFNVTSGNIVEVL
jgi:hypothetical protein